MKKVPKGGDVLNGQFAPEGTRVGHSMWALQRDSVYGPDVDIFGPERWIEGDEERVAQMERQLEHVFGFGRYGCVGKLVAFVQLNKVLVEVSFVPYLTLLMTLLIISIS